MCHDTPKGVVIFNKDFSLRVNDLWLNITAAFQSGKEANMDHSLPSLIWVITRLQLQNEALIDLLSKQRPGLRHQFLKEQETLRKSNRVAQLFAENMREIEQASDGIWLLQQGISEIEPPPERT